jgi:hypothetical protein
MSVDLTAVLNCRMTPGNDAGAETIRDYLKALLTELWREKEGFGGKRPFGNSGWEADVYIALIVGGFVEGSVDEDGYYDGCDEYAADSLIADAIRAL